MVPLGLGVAPPWASLGVEVHASPHRWFLHTRALCVNQDSCISEEGRVSVREIPGQLFVGGLSPSLWGGGESLSPGVCQGKVALASWSSVSLFL